MPYFGFLFGLCLPRIFSLYAYFLTEWFDGVFDGRLWPILGFVFLPRAVLWYSVVTNWLHGSWSTWAVIDMAVAVTIDLGFYGAARRRR
ncbi:hypothetical protein JW899_01210 [Candidatus Uhrbacteria bacterium]|nr:hypothetical protein [Candidatus Uhrbacteria bacterium]